jgi:hypothetical protein
LIVPGEVFKSGEVLFVLQVRELGVVGNHVAW